MSFDLKDIWAHMGPSALLIAGLLVVMAIASLAVFFERLFVYSRSRRLSRTFARRSAPLLQERRLQDFVALAEATKGSHLAQLLGRGVATFLARKEQAGSKE